MSSKSFGLTVQQVILSNATGNVKAILVHCGCFVDVVGVGGVVWCGECGGGWGWGRATNEPRLPPSPAHTHPPPPSPTPPPHHHHPTPPTPPQPPPTPTTTITKGAVTLKEFHVMTWSCMELTRLIMICQPVRSHAWISLFSAVQIEGMTLSIKYIYSYLLYISLA